MASASITENDKSIYEKEFSTFLIQRINQSGGCMQFQHLYGALQQIRYEVREAFGTSKSELMKFLRAHRNTFKVDSKGIVTVVDSPAEESQNSDCIELAAKVSNIKPKKTLPPEIQNGKGKIIRISAEFGVIMADEPIGACVYFTPANYNDNKDGLFVGRELWVGCKVYFNAVYGNDDHEIQYRAIKVWRKHREDEYPVSYKENLKKYNHAEEKNKAFDKIDLKAKKESKYQRKVVEEEKNSEKYYFHPSSHSREDEKDKKETARKKEFLENEPGRIYPYEKKKNGAIIKFGKNYAEFVDGDSSTYYLYGAEVSDIRWEFTEGQDVLFDAVATKTAPYWKAVTVWVGEKPISAKNISCIEESDEDQNYISASSESSECKATKSQINTEFVRKKPDTISDHSISKKGTRSYAKHKHDNFEYSRNNSQKTKKNKFRSKKSDYKRKNVSYQECSEEDSETDSETCNSEDFQKRNGYEYSVTNDRFKFKTAEEEVSSEHSYKTVSESDKKCDVRENGNIRIFNDIEGNITRVHPRAAFIKSSVLQKEFSFVITNFYLDGQSASEDQSVTDLKEVLEVNEVVKFNCFIIIDDQAEEYSLVTMAWKGKKPEVKHEMTPEEFIAAYDLSVSINNDLDSKSIQEHEKTQNRFFTVVENLDSDNEYDSQTKQSVLNILSEDRNVMTEDENDVSEDTNDTSEDTNDVPEDTNDTSEVDIVGRCAESAMEVNGKDREISINTHYKSLSEKIIQELKSSGVITFHPQVDLNPVIDGISSILKNFNRDEALNQEVPLRCLYPSDPSEVLCSKCIKQKKSTAEVQTIITGEIVATRDKFPEWKKKRSR